MVTLHVSATCWKESDAASGSHHGMSDHSQSAQGFRAHISRGTRRVNSSGSTEHHTEVTGFSPSLVGSFTNAVVAEYSRLIADGDCDGIAADLLAHPSIKMKPIDLFFVGSGHEVGGLPMSNIANLAGLRKHRQGVRSKVAKKYQTKVTPWTVRHEYPLAQVTVTRTRTPTPTNRESSRRWHLIANPSYQKVMECRRRLRGDRQAETSHRQAGR